MICERATKSSRQIRQCSKIIKAKFFCVFFFFFFFFCILLIVFDLDTNVSKPVLIGKD